MASNFPRRPPRRSGADTSAGSSKQESGSAGLLVNVVRTLTTSASEDQKEFEKKKLENGYRETGKTIDGLIASHQTDLTSSLQAFRKVSNRITATRERVRNVKNSVSACKSLLQCKREELQKLWMENAEQKYVTSLLEQVEAIRKVPEDAKEAADKKQFLNASELLLNAVVSLEGDLIVIDGLRDMKEEIRRKNEAIYERILDEIHNVIYLMPTEELMRDFQKGRMGSDLALRSSSCIAVDENDYPILQDNGCAFEDPDGVNPETNPVQYLAVLCEALGVLRRVPGAVEDIRHRIQRGLTRMVHNTTLAYYEYQLRGLAGEEAIGKGIGDGRNLAEVLQLLFRQFKIVGVLHHILLGQLKRVLETRHISEASLYEVEDVWAQIQVVLQQFLGDYLDVNHLEAIGHPAAAAVIPNIPLSHYFAKKRPPRAKRPSLFRFEGTNHAQNVSAFAREQRSHEIGVTERFSFHEAEISAVRANLGLPLSPKILDQSQILVSMFEASSSDIKTLTSMLSTSLGYE